MKSTEFHPVHYDAHGRLRLPLLFWLVLLLQARTWVLFVIAGASREQGTALLNLFYPDHDNFWLGLIPGIPAVLAFSAINLHIKKKEQAGASVFAEWSAGFISPYLACALFSVAVGAGGFTLLATVAVAER